MKKLYNKIKMDNRGVSLSLALIAIIFVTLLASTVMAVSMSNLSLKRTEVMGKRSFYTAETAVDKLYSGLGAKALERLNDAYVEQMGNMMTYDSASGTMVKTGNAAMNDGMRKSFVNLFLQDMTGQTLTPANIYEGAAGDATVKQYLNTILGIDPAVADSYDKAQLKVSSVGKVTANASGTSSADFYVTIADVVINYAADGYFADITTDFKLTYPDITVNFNNENPLDFLEYCLIANENIGVGSFSITGAENVTANVANNIYAGKEINISNGSTLNINNEAKAVGHSGVNLYSSESAASILNLSNAILWTEGDVLIQKPGGAHLLVAGGKITADAASTMYVGDDLELRDVENSEANIQGKYVGYGYGTTADQNSSIILNARNCTLNMQLDTLELLGRAYIEAISTGTLSSDANEFRTADSLAVKETQQIYLVLDSLLDGYTNPMPIGEPHDVTTEIKNKILDEANFFAADLLDGADPIRVIEDGSRVYYYYNFNSSSYDKAAEAYLNAVKTGVLTKLDGTQVDVTSYSSWKQVNTIWQRNIDKTFKNGGGINVSATNVNTLGPILSQAATGSSALAAGGLSDALAQSMSAAHMNRVGGKASAASELPRLFGIQMADADAFHQIINTSHISQANRVDNADIQNGTAAKYDYPKTAEASGVTYELYVVKEADKVLSNLTTAEHAIIIHTGTGVFQVDKNFDGLLISAGTIDVTKNALVTTNSTHVKEILETTPSFAQFFKAYKSGDNEDSSIGGLSYEDFVSMMNWRKFEDAATAP